MVDRRLTPTRLDRRAFFLRDEHVILRDYGVRRRERAARTEQTEAQHKGFILEPMTDTRTPATKNKHGDLMKIDQIFTRVITQNVIINREVN